MILEIFVVLAFLIFFITLRLPVFFLLPELRPNTLFGGLRAIHESRTKDSWPNDEFEKWFSTYILKSDQKSIDRRISRITAETIRMIKKTKRKNGKAKSAEEEVERMKKLELLEKFGQSWCYFIETKLIADEE
jgi:hypothetical protein